MTGAEPNVHLLDDGLGGAEFLDEAVQVGKWWAREHPETAANGEPLLAAEAAG
jgi:hypothetical protein